MSFFDKLKNFDAELTEHRGQIPISNEDFPKPPSNEQADTAGDTAGKEREDRWLPESEGQLAVDVYQTEDHLVIASTIGGVKPDSLDISFENDVVTIRGQREKQEEIPPENYFCQECYFGPFSRSVILPIEVNPEKAEASMKDGILTIRIPKLHKEKMKKIEVKLA